MRILLCFFLISNAVWADRTDVIPLRHKLPEDLVSPLRQTFPEAGIQTFNGQLIVRAPDDATFRRIVDLVNRLDTATRSLRITVEQREGSSTNSRRIDAQGQVIISNRGSGGQITINGDQRDSQRSSNASQSVRTMDGSPAFIQLGSQRFIPTLSFSYRPGYRIATVGGEWQSAGTGFYAEPRLIGDQVQLRLSPQSSHFTANGNVNVKSVYSEVQGQLGEWLPIGESVQQSAGEQSGSTSNGSMQGSKRYSVWARVDAE